MQKSQKGFGLVALLIGIVLVAVVGLVAWRVWDSTRNTSDAQSGQPQDTPQANGNQNEPAQHADPNEGYLVIKEWGVKFKSIEGLEGVEYVLGSQTSVAEENVTFTTKELATYGNACSGKMDGDAPLGILTRSKTQQDEFASQSSAFVKRVEEYYYRYTTPQSACSDDSSARTLQTQVVQAFKPSIATLEAAQ